MALSRAAAAAARKAAKSRGLKGNRAEDGSLRRADTNLDEYGTRMADENAMQRDIKYREKLEDYTPEELQNEVLRIEMEIDDAEVAGDTVLVAQLEKQYEIAWDMLDDSQQYHLSSV